MNIPGLGGNRRRIYGVVIGIVTDNKHPDGEYRVKVRFPWIRDATDAGDAEDFICKTLTARCNFRMQRTRRHRCRVKSNVLLSNSMLILQL